MIIGPVSRDIMIDCHDVETRLVGGAVVQSGFAAANVGARTAIFTKASPDIDVYGAFADCPNLKHVYMPQKTVIIGSNVFPAGVTIHGKDGSYAEFYANKNGFDFIAE